MSVPQKSVFDLPPLKEGDRLGASWLNAIAQMARGQNGTPPARGGNTDATGTIVRPPPRSKGLWLRAESGDLGDVPEYSILEVYSARLDGDGPVLLVQKPTDLAQLYAGNEGSLLAEDGQVWVKVITPYDPVLVRCAEVSFLDKVQPALDGDELTLEAGGSLLYALTSTDEDGRALVLAAGGGGSSYKEGYLVGALAPGSNPPTSAEVTVLGEDGTLTVDNYDPGMYAQAGTYVIVLEVNDSWRVVYPYPPANFVVQVTTALGSLKAAEVFVWSIQRSGTNVTRTVTTTKVWACNFRTNTALPGYYQAIRLENGLVAIDNQSVFLDAM